MRLREVLGLALALAALAPAVAPAEEPLTLARAAQLALAADPEVRRGEAEVRAARARVAGASSTFASNPEVSAAAGPRDGGARRTTDYEVSLSQRIEVAGQRGTRIAAARAGLATAEARLAARRAQLAAEVRDLLGRLAAARMRAQVAEEEVRLAGQALRAAEKRHGAGDAPLIEVNGARIEAGRAARAALEAGLAKGELASELEIALGYAPGALPELAFELAAETAAPESGDEALASEALERRPDVIAARLELTAAEAERTLAGRAAVPSPAVGVSYAREEGANVVLGTLSFELPLFARNEAERGASSARVEQARATLGATEARARQEVRLSLERVRTARLAVAALRDGALPAAAENLALVTRAYEAGQLELVRFLLLRREALQARREHIDALEELNRAEAHLRRALGEGPSHFREDPRT